MSITKVVRYVSGVTTIYLGSPLDPWGPGGTRGGPQGSRGDPENIVVSPDTYLITFVSDIL